MKKKEITSKLQLQKITIVSFNSLSNLNGGALQNTDTYLMSVDGYTCLKDICVSDSPTTALDNTCPPPTNTQNGITDFCDDDTIKKCNVSVRGC